MCCMCFSLIFPIFSSFSIVVGVFLYMCSNFVGQNDLLCTVHYLLLYIPYLYRIDYCCNFCILSTMNNKRYATRKNTIFILKKNITNASVYACPFFFFSGSQYTYIYIRVYNIFYYSKTNK